jgi:hypothetical protein
MVGVSGNSPLSRVLDAAVRDLNRRVILSLSLRRKHRRRAGNERSHTERTHESSHEEFSVW